MGSGMREAAREREAVLACWMASFNEVPLLVRPFMHNWTTERILIRDLAKLGVTPECWEYDDDALDRARVPLEKVAA